MTQRPVLRRRLRLAAPAALALLGAWLLSGCVFLPTFDNTIPGENAARSVGGKRSSKPIRLHVATRDDVMRLLGWPRLASPDLTRIAYSWDVRNGIWVFPLCFVADQQEGRRTLVLTFDESAILRTAEVLKQDGNWLESTPVGRGFIPWDMLPQHRTARQRPASQPVPAPATAPAAHEGRGSGMNAFLRTVAPLAVCVAASGCVPLPGNYRPISGGMRPEEKIGATDEAPLRLGRSTRERAVAVLGPPAMVSADGRSLAYTYHVSGFLTLWIVPFALMPVTDWHDRVLRLRFDDAGTLTSFKVFAYDWPGARTVGGEHFISYDHYRKSVGAVGYEFPLPPIDSPGSTEPRE